MAFRELLGGLDVGNIIGLPELRVVWIVSCSRLLARPGPCNWRGKRIVGHLRGDRNDCSSSLMLTKTV